MLDEAMIRTKKIRGGLSPNLTRPSLIYQRVGDLLVKISPYAPSFEKYNISIDHNRKIMWFRIAKNGTRTIFDVLKSSNVTLHAEHPMLCRYPVMRYKDYYKFAFVRNPWDRLVSCWYDKVIYHNYFGLDKVSLNKIRSFSSFVEYVSSVDVRSADQHLRLQTRLVDLNNIDYVGRFENFENDLVALLKFVGLECGPIPKLNATASGRLPYAEYYDRNLIEKVAAIYRADITTFGYEF